MPTSLTRESFVLVTHLQATWNRAGRENVDQHLAVEREGRVLPHLLHFDPAGGRYFAWLAAWRRSLWDTRGFGVSLDLGELDEVRRALARFDDLRDRLPVDRRDVGRYLSVEDLAGAVPKRLAENERKKEAEALKTEAYLQSEVLFDEGRWVVTRIRGFAAARFWGLGTRWCTTSSEGIYRQYATGGDLLVFLTPSGKYQLATRSQVFRDERDAPVDPKVFRNAPAAFRALLHRYRGGLA